MPTEAFAILDQVARRIRRQIDSVIARVGGAAPAVPLTVRVVGVESAALAKMSAAGWELGNAVAAQVVLRKIEAVLQE